ncbi:MAG: SLC13 family permease [Acidobacteria bacterium]|nr:SLC13 family permease [Acidobacteriota bacterium]
MTTPIILTLTILLITVGLFVWNRLRIDVVGLVSLTLVSVTGLVTPAEALSGFSNEAVLTVAGMFVLSAALLRTGLVDALGRWFMRTAGESELRALVVGLAIVIPLSAFLNNTPIVLVMVPVMLTLARKRGIAPSRLLMPVSFASQLGGTTTLIGTSTNLLVAGLALQLGLPRIRLFDMTLPALIITGIGVVYLLTLGRKLLPTRSVGHGLIETYELRDYLTTLRVHEDSPLAGRSLRDSKFGENLGLQVVAIDRGDQRIHAVRGGMVIQAGDLLLARGNVGNIAQLSEVAHLEVVKPKDDLLIEESVEKEEEVRLVELIVPPRSPVIGRTLKQLAFRARYGVPVLGIQRHGVVIRDHLADVGLRSGDTLLVEAAPTALRELYDSDDLAVMSAVNPPTRRTSKMKIASPIMVGVVVLAAFEILPIVVSVMVGVVAMFLTGCIRPEEAYEDIDWMVLVLLGSIIPLGIAMQNSGTSALIAEQFLALSSGFGPYGALAAFYLLASLLTAVISNNAAAVVLTPVAISAALTLGVSPMPFVIAMMFAASNSFMTPIGYQTNTFIYAPGGYRFSDFVRVGAPLNVLMIIAATFVIPRFFPF